MKLILLIFIFFFQFNPAKGQSLHVISKSKISEIGNKFSKSGEYFIYTTIDIDKKKHETNYGFNLVKADKPRSIIFHQSAFKFIDFLKDSLVLGLNDSDKLFSFNVFKKEVIKTYDLTLSGDDYLSLNYKYDNGGIYYLDYNKIKFYNITTGIIDTIFKTSYCKFNYQRITSFDIKNDTLLICFNLSLFNYDVYMFDIRNKRLIAVKHNITSQNQTFFPIVRFSKNNNVIYTYYLNGSSYLYNLNYRELEKGKVSKLGKNIIINYSSNYKADDFLTLFNEKRREHFARMRAKKVGIGVFWGGCHVYKL